LVWRNEVWQAKNSLKLSMIHTLPIYIYLVVHASYDIRTIYLRLVVMSYPLIMITTTL
jgi:hypothetical protein